MPIAGNRLLHHAGCIRGFWSDKLCKQSFSYRDFEISVLSKENVSSPGKQEDYLYFYILHFHWYLTVIFAHCLCFLSVVWIQWSEFCQLNSEIASESSFLEKKNSECKLNLGFCCCRLWGFFVYLFWGGVGVCFFLFPLLIASKLNHHVWVALLSTYSNANKTFESAYSHREISAKEQNNKTCNDFHCFNPLRNFSWAV